MNNTKACIFDAYGTLFDVNAACRELSLDVGDKWQDLANLWRLRQVEYTWLRNSMNEYVDFWEITSNALDYAMEVLNIKNIKFPIRDLTSPQTNRLKTFKELIKIILSFIHKSKPVLVHCNAGLGRSGLVAAVVCKELKIPNAINFVRSYRKGAIENEAQENFVINWKLMTRLS